MDNKPVRFLREWGSRGCGVGEFHFPIDIAINSSDEIFITDFYNARVQKFDTDGQLLGVFSVAPNPGGAALDDAGNIYTSHFGKMQENEVQKPDKVTVHSASGKLLQEWGKTGTGSGEFDYPGGIAIGGDGYVYIADQTNHRIQVFDGKGAFVKQWGQHGIETGQFGGNVNTMSRVAGPQFIAIDSVDNIYTTEGSMGRVQKFTVNGEFLLAWGDNSLEPGGFGGGWMPGAGLQGPICICVDPQDNVWVSAVNGRIQQFSNEGEYLRGFGEERGSGPGQFQAPHGMAFDSHGHFYVVDSYNHRIQKFMV